MTQKLVRWETPFTDVRYPSVVTFVNQASDDNSIFPVEVIVSPAGLDGYPKYRVSFGHAIAFSAMEEMFFPEFYFFDAGYDDEGNSCAYKILESPWITSYSRCEYFLFNTDKSNTESLTHYVIFGGDDIFQVVTRHEPIIEPILERMTLTVNFSI